MDVVQGKSRFVGTFPDAASAPTRYDRAATKAHGANVALNFPPGSNPKGVLTGTHLQPLLVALGGIVAV